MVTLETFIKRVSLARESAHIRVEANFRSADVQPTLRHSIIAEIDAFYDLVLLEVEGFLNSPPPSAANDPVMLNRWKISHSRLSLANFLTGQAKARGIGFRKVDITKGPVVLSSPKNPPDFTRIRLNRPLEVVANPQEHSYSANSVNSKSTSTSSSPLITSTQLVGHKDTENRRSPPPTTKIFIKSSDSDSESQNSCPIVTSPPLIESLFTNGQQPNSHLLPGKLPTPENRPFKRYASGTPRPKPYQCRWPTCTADFNSYSYILKHIRNKHLMVPKRSVTVVGYEETEKGVTRLAKEYIGNELLDRPGLT